MNILIIEDDPNKAQKIIEYLQMQYPDINILLEKSYQSGLKSIFNIHFDGVLLDMSIPTYDLDDRSFSGKPRNYGGRDILKEMKRYKICIPVIVITQYNDFDGGTISMEELDKQLKAGFESTYLGYIYYVSKQTDWQDKLQSYINILNK